MPYEDQRVTIIGLGREGAALARFLAQHGARVSISDIKGEEALRDRIDELADFPIDYLLGEHPEESLEADVIFVSPGVLQEIPILVEARRRGIPLSSETRLFFSLCRAPIIGITGSSGKTTTTSLVGEMMRAEGYRTFVGGNIGSPLIAFVEEIEPEDKVVMELSSFQLEVLDQSPHIAAILNLSPNHLDRHQSMDDYVAAKANILRFQGENDYAVLNADQQLTRELTKDCQGQVLLVSRAQELDEGAFLKQEEVTVRWGGRVRKVCHASDIQLLGSHNLENILAACAIATVAEVQVEAMASVVTSFSGVEHRLELVNEIEGVKYYDDSIATSPDRAMAALNSFAEPVILLAGGREKHLPLEGLAKLIVRRVKSLILFGEAAPLLEQAVIKAQGEETGDEVPIYRSSNLIEAVRIAAQISQAGDIVLLSPACTSFDMYRDFAERGDHFETLVRELRNPQVR
jgi:UDP-N-acetylmuramoylalanine--D-glutamate ligase